jgi:hypothetical protein
VVVILLITQTVPIETADEGPHSDTPCRPIGPNTLTVELPATATGWRSAHLVGGRRLWCSDMSGWRLRHAVAGRRARGSESRSPPTCMSRNM